MNWSDRVYLGTWQFGGQFKQLSSEDVESLICFALDSGIYRFDTAVVYGAGKVEEMLGKLLPTEAKIITKIPAITKPNIYSAEPIDRFYSCAHIERNVLDSMSRLRRKVINVVLLHNWLPTWSSDAIDILEFLQNLKQKGIVEKVGVSLPNGFFGLINQEILSFFDVVEAPFNPEENWICNQLAILKAGKKEILLRSIFQQGKLLARYSALELLEEAMKLQTSIVVGMTTQEQIKQNINYFKKEVISDTAK